MTIHATAIDPRDANWLDNSPAYRVYFFDSVGAADEWRLSCAGSVSEVIAWANDTAGGRLFVMYVECRTEQGIGIIRLKGRDPNEH